MKSSSEFFLVSADALPEVFLRVLEVKRYLGTGEASTVNQAANMAGISRSAYYKYKDAVRPFFDAKAGKIISFQMVLRDQPGVLSSMLSIFAACGANILTINQSIPINGCAAVTISAETTAMNQPLNMLVEKAGELNGVVKFEISVV